MKTLKFFLLFLTVESARCYEVSTARSPIRANDIFELMNAIAATSEFEEFRRTLEATYENNEEFRALRLGGSTAPVQFSLVVPLLTSMTRQLLLQSVFYLARRLIELCFAALWLIEKTPSPYFDGYVRERIRLPDDRVNCIVAAVHAYGIHYDRLIEMISFFQTVEPDDRYPLRDIEPVLINYLYNFKRYYILPEEFITFFPRFAPDAALDDVLYTLHRVKTEITDFSNMFCLRWKPIVSHALMSKSVWDEIRNESRFVRNVFLNEKCRILNGDIVYGTTTNDLGIYSVKRLIRDWDCGNILVTRPEQRKNTGDRFSCAKCLSFLVSRVFLRDSGRPEPEPKPESVGRDLSLAEMKEALTANKLFWNAWIYYTVVSRVVLMAAIREGLRVRGGIALVVRRSCSEPNDNAVDTIRGLRPKLCAFKVAFDRLVRLLQLEKRFDVASDPHKMEFDARVSQLVRLLDVRDGAAVVKQWCPKILRELEDTDVRGPAYPAKGNATDANQFGWDYFDEPIIHVGQLYRFSEYGF